MAQNQDQGYKEFLKGYQEARLTESSTWEIREMIRRVEHDVSITEKDHTLRWHMILHLAQKFEEQKREADSLLKALKQKDSILKGAIEDMDPKNNLLGDLPQFESDFLTNDHILREVVEAWFALFGGYLQDHELFITFNRDVLNFCSQCMEDSGTDIGTTHNQDMTFRFPALSHRISEVLKVSEKRSFNESQLAEFKTLLREYRKDPEGNLFGLKELSKEIEASLNCDPLDRTLNIKMRYIPPIADTEYSNKDKLFYHFLNKTIILMEEADHNA